MNKNYFHIPLVSLILLSSIGTAWAVELPPALETTVDTTSPVLTDTTTTTTTTNETTTVAPQAETTETTVTAPSSTTTSDTTTPATTPVKAFEDFKDVSVEYPEYNAIIVLRYQGLLKGYDDNTFHPDQPLNRVEALKLAFEAAQITISNGIAPAKFTDTEDSAWYSGYLNKALYLEVVGGYPDGSFQPAKSVNTVEFLKMLFLTQKADLTKTDLAQIPYADVMPGQWYSKYVNYAKINDLLKTDADNKIFPDQPLTRARAADIIYRFRNMKAKPVNNTTTQLATTTGNTVIPVKDFALYVSKSYQIAFQYPKIWFYSAYVTKIDPADIAIYGFGPKDLSTNPAVVNLELLPDNADFKTNLIHEGFSYLREETDTKLVKLSAKINGSKRIYRISGQIEQEANMLTMLESLTTNIEGLESNNPAAAAAATTTTTSTTTTPVDTTTPTATPASTPEANTNDTTPAT